MGSNKVPHPIVSKKRYQAVHAYSVNTAVEQLKRAQHYLVASAISERDTALVDALVGHLQQPAAIIRDERPVSVAGQDARRMCDPVEEAILGLTPRGKDEDKRLGGIFVVSFLVSGNNTAGIGRPKCGISIRALCSTISVM